MCKQYNNFESTQAPKIYLEKSIWIERMDFKEENERGILYFSRKIGLDGEYVFQRGK